MRVMLKGVLVEGSATEILHRIRKLTFHDQPTFEEWLEAWVNRLRKFFGMPLTQESSHEEIVEALLERKLILTPEDDSSLQKGAML